MKEIREGFEKLVCNPDLLSQLPASSGSAQDFPPAPGGLRVYWDTLYGYHGWKLQKNYYFKHYRILDKYSVQKASGVENDMISALKAIGSPQ